MALPYFYIPTYDPASAGLTLDEDNSRHAVQVLRMQRGEALQLTDGKGSLLTATIVDDHKKKCRVAITAALTSPQRATSTTIAISPLKNGSRFEWFLEKATEIGVSAIIPTLCERTERSSIRQQRLQNILVSAMLQSQQTWLPVLSDPMSLEQLIREVDAPRRYIAHCLEAPRATDNLAGVVREQTPAASLILIGPEGDLSPKEVETALAAGYRPVSLGANRLRTETAGIVAATLLCIR
ncbi:MAG TPA: RsmE family RNA methyltransferase [Puia sp.]|nr:RsmE family RNA methyltransferase [Puia sp.]